MAQVFISYSARDTGFVEHLAEFLRRHGIKAWYSKAGIRGSDQWERVIRDALYNSDWFVVVMSPRSAESKWVRAEVHWAIGNREGRIVPLLLGNCRADEFHLLLEPIQHIDCRARREAAFAEVVRLFASEAPPPPPPRGGRKGGGRKGVGKEAERVRPKGGRGGRKGVGSRSNARTPITLGAFDR